MKKQPKFELTNHARVVVQERDISLSWIKRVFESPEREEDDKEDTNLKHYLRKISEHGDRVLRIVVNYKISPVMVVTAYFDRAMRGKL